MQKAHASGHMQNMQSSCSSFNTEQLKLRESCINVVKKCIPKLIIHCADAEASAHLEMPDHMAALNSFLTTNYRPVILNWRFCVNEYWKDKHAWSKRENITFGIKRSSTFLVNQIYELEPHMD